MGRRLTVAVLVAASLWGAAGAHGQTTETTTIGDANGDGRLEQRDGDAREVRQELATANAARAQTRANMLFFGQLTDAHVIDEESPLRVEFTDPLHDTFKSAYRPQEGLSAQVLDRMVRQVRTTTSPVDGRRLDLVVSTGDNTDNGQCNETRWFIDVLDGGRIVDPDSGLEPGTDTEGLELCRTAESPPPVPVPPSCDLPQGSSQYDGVRGGGEYYEPDASTGQDGPGYAPQDGVRDFPGLLEEMNEPFRSAGFGDIPWYAVFGNHDGLIQGNQPRNPGFEAFGIGCVKVRGLTEADRLAITSAPTKELAMAEALAAMRRGAQTRDAETTELIPPDPRRRPLRKTEYIAQHFENGGGGHGFREEGRTTGEGHYSFSPAGRAGLKFVVLDTISEHGLEEGNIDDDQFRWLHEELLAAERAAQRVVVLAHHSLKTMGQPPVSPFLPGDTFGNLSPVVHLGIGPRNTGQRIPCAKADPALPTDPTETVRCLLLRHKSVIAFVNGHEHNNRIDPFTSVAGDAPAPGRFWEINTASHVDWPQQSRVLDLVDNRDGTLSIFGTLVDHASPVDPGDGPVNASVARLASISRELSFNDPQAKNGRDGATDARGADKDRNVELLVPDPYAAAGPLPAGGL